MKVDVTEYDRLHLAPVTRGLIHPYSDTAACTAELRCMALEEIVANKLKCLIQRRHSHDLFDLVYTTFINRSTELDRTLVLRTFLSKTIFSASPGAAKEILLGLPMTFFGSVWEKFIRCPKPTRFGFDKAVDGFKDAIEALFEGVQTRMSGERAFFPSGHRNLIMEAGGERKLLRLTYEGVERFVEPYSLAYKRPSTGAPREYFYAYDRTGGRTSGPGIKSFVHTGINRMELTAERFEPRYDIELAKAGEDARKGYFGQAFSAGSPPRQGRAPKARAFKGFQQSYKVQCPYCQKQFTRVTASLELKAHKAPNGYPCAARRGYRAF